MQEPFQVRGASLTCCIFRELKSYRESTDLVGLADFPTGWPNSRPNAPSLFPPSPRGWHLSGPLRPGWNAPSLFPPSPRGWHLSGRLLQEGGTSPLGWNAPSLFPPSPRGWHLSGPKRVAPLRPLRWHLSAGQKAGGGGIILAISRHHAGREHTGRSSPSPFALEAKLPFEGG